MAKEYFGDGVYAEHDGYQIWLTTEADMLGNTNRIALDPGVMHELIAYAQVTGTVEDPAGDQ